MLLGPLALVVVSETQAGLERLDQCVSHRRVSLASEHAGGVGRLVGSSQHHGGLGFQEKRLAIFGSQQFGGGLTAEPLP